ncbi:hypothetical protein NE237_024261 [Protea cynaroides]|uniref:BHLH domain-containing protein n=1 Tax=Protea cynaroides TaxID=273540 RepID=A0A9Q0K655_9MAGN|nr:hypothetical protein NE237_024261 [Protea cynaroides]
MFPFSSYYGLINNPSNKVLDGGFVQVQGGRSMEMMMKAAAEEKVVAACKSHSEAERRRRERINGHLATLRSLLPNVTKMDKASLLAEVVQQVKDLKKQADDSREWWWLPGEMDELRLDYCDEEAEVIRASVCCEDQPELVRDLSMALRSVEERVRVVKVEIGTIGGRMKSVIVVKKRSSDVGTEGDLLGELRKVLKGVIDKSGLSVTASMLQGNKRQRFSL